VKLKKSSGVNLEEAPINCLQTSERKFQFISHYQHLKITFHIFGGYRKDTQQMKHGKQHTFQMAFWLHACTLKKRKMMI